MMSIGVWNVRGLNKAVKQKEVMDVIRDNKLGMCAVVESHVKISNLKNVCSKSFGNWDWVSNNKQCDVGTRIIVGWDPKLFDVMVLSQSKQVIHCFVKFSGSNYSMFFSFIYAASGYIERRVLWEDLKKFSLTVKKEAWCILGDFNVVLKDSDYSEGCSRCLKGVDDFRECINFIEVEDLNSTGFQFTWNKSPSGNKGILKKLDRIMVNTKFISDYPSAYAAFKPYRTSDHCPAILFIPNDKLRWKASFRFANFIADKEEFLPMVKDIWSSNIEGFFMFKVTQKLKMLKSQCKQMCSKFRGSGRKIKDLREQLGNIQLKIDQEPFNASYREEHANILFEYNVACNDEEKLLSQRSKIKWLSDGDNNTKFFHSCLKSRINRNRILMVLDEDGRWIRGKAMKEKFINHFKNFLGCEVATDLSILNNEFFINKLDKKVAMNMIRVVTDEEVKVAMFDIADNHAPGPDGFSSKFFKSAWSIIGTDICKAVREFFWTGKLLKGINATRIVLIPKVEEPRKVTDFRPIACCNIFYKCISKIIVNRIRGSLSDIVSHNQSAFIQGRSILDNILLAQELMVGYKNKKGMPKCTLKIDIQKAYDTVDWKFLNRILIGFGFHPVMVNWIMACTSSPWFMLNFNGEDHGYFEGKRGLRQGDPLSPYLFTLVMEVFNLILVKKIEESQCFKFHCKCDSQRITHLCFADDLLVFSFGNGNSARVIKAALDDFYSVSGLKASMEKSQIFFSCVKPNMRRIILGILPFDIGKIPFKYLGIPMCVNMLFKRDCFALVDKIKLRVCNWKNKMLSFAGRLQLINSVLTSIHVYWASIFKIPIATIREIEMICRNFLWANGEVVRGKAKVKWSDVCKPKINGGLGIKDLRFWNDALLIKHIWNLISNKKSLWVQWVRENYIGDGNFWEIWQKKSMNWTWKRFLELRKTVRHHIVSCVGDGRNTSLWHDWWHPIGILSTIISRRDWFRNGFSENSLVSDVLTNDTYRWPVDWVINFPGLKDAPMFCNIGNQKDITVWRDMNGVNKKFSCKQVWRDINNFGSKVKWVSCVWYSNCIPRNAFILWLAVLNRLKTQDRVKCWEKSGSLLCPFCLKIPDSHDHLFFQCEFTHSIWKHCCSKAGIDISYSNWNDLVLKLSSVLNSRSIENLIKKWIFASCVAHIWKERNSRIFSKLRKSNEGVILCIEKEIQLKLLGLRKMNVMVSREILQIWGIFGKN